MAKNKNYNYAFVFYDVKEARVNKVFKVNRLFIEREKQQIGLPLFIHKFFNYIH